MNLGILLPSSRAYPGTAFEFMDGLKIFFGECGLTDKVKLFTENIGYGGVEKEVYEKAEKLLLMDNVDVLIAYIDLKVKSVLEPLLYSSGKLMIIVNPGANYPSNWIAQPNIVHLNLQHAFLCWLTGALARDEAVMASSFYDCGYLHTAAMVKGFLRQGGRITYNYISNQPAGQMDLKSLTDFLSANRSVKNLLCLFDSLPASLFYKLLNAYEDAGKLRVFASPMMLHPQAINGSDPLQFSIDGYLPWSLSLENKANIDFIDRYHEHAKKSPTIFSLLGWETGLIIQKLIQLANGVYSDGTALMAQMKNDALEGPRGKLQLDPLSNYFIAPVYKCSVQPGEPKMQIEEDGSQEKWKTFTREKVEGISSGWLNTYLCY